MKSIVLLLVVALTSVARGEEILVPSGESVAQMLAAHPRILAAAAEVDAAAARAQEMRIGPHEFTFDVEGTRRSIEDVDDVTEWNVGVSRGFRWPWKATVAGDLADVEVEIARARLEVVWRDLALEYARAWSEWSRAAALVRRARADHEDAEARVEIQRRNLANGVGLELELDQLVSDAAIAELALVDARRVELDARLQLHGLFSDAATTHASVPLAQVETADRLDPLEQPIARAAALQARRAILKARERGRDRLPDPEVGVFWFDELGGAETGIGASLSIPLTGRARNAASNAAHAERRAFASRSEVTGFETKITLDRAALAFESAAEALEAARRAAGAARNAVERMRRGRELDVVTMTELIIARRTARATDAIVTEREHALVRARLEWAILAGEWPAASPLRALSGAE